MGYIPIILSFQIKKHSDKGINPLTKGYSLTCPDRIGSQNQERQELSVIEVCKV